ncbi:disulfide bond formation protein DsbB [Spinactinospora alkalitolerans]|uniref:Disulfide bond formation protein DsbB n=1 Tax=Spinactinospora alkalitolerans TaxID=687207 RepID=A0A852TM66_9ACTN|nr:hypothetical protein [Spinactinospora alkalitolerans]NYE45356.1 disulfide bond formation protein DsbB [Spinactinospora alkalitolerans]
MTTIGSRRQAAGRFPVFAALNSVLTAIAVAAVIFLHAFAAPLAVVSGVLAGVGVKTDPGRRNWHLALLVVSALALLASLVLTGLLWSTGNPAPEATSAPAP